MWLKPKGRLLFCPSTKVDGNIPLLFILLQTEHQTIAVRPLSEVEG
jgi:hypothetical protein